MDYDKTNVPETYDAGREISGSEKSRMLAYFASNISADKVAAILDLGCGTGRLTQALSDTFDAGVVGVDPSQKMLDQARQKTASQRITFKRAAGETLPLDDGSVDMVFMSMVLHHLNDPQQTFHECQRVLRSGGHVCLRNTVTDEIPSYPYLDIFPSIRSIIEGQLISRAQLEQFMTAAGFERAAHQSVWGEISGGWQAFADKVALKADSFVARLEEQEFVSGLAALREKAGHSDPNERVGQNVDRFIYRRL